MGRVCSMIEKSENSLDRRIRLVVIKNESRGGAMAYHYLVGKIVMACWQLQTHQEHLPEDVNRAVRNVVLPDHFHPNVRELKIPLENYLKTADRKDPLSKQCEKILDLVYCYDSHTISRKTSFVNYLARKLFRKKD